MKLRRIRPKIGAIKATVQKNGRLGFSSQAAKELKLPENRFVRFFVNDEDETDENLYFSLLRTEEEDVFKVLQAGDYFYLNTRNLFNDLGVDYVRKKVIYDIGKITYEGEELYKLIGRTKDRQM